MTNGGCVMVLQSAVLSFLQVKDDWFIMQKTITKLLVYRHFMKNLWSTLNKLQPTVSLLFYTLNMSSVIKGKS